jgi:ligand-binding SRPBCC domain-containing protein
MNWVTEITHVTHHKYFVDEQRFGPYAFWHHKHFLREVSEGIEMTEILHYKFPLGFIGQIINTLFIQRKINEIFDYRFKTLEKVFNHAK